MKGRFSKHSEEYLVAELLKHFEEMSLHNLAKKIGVGSKRLGDIARRLGLKRNRKSVWTQEMEDYMCTHYANTLNTDIAKALGLSESAIIAKAFMLQLRKSAEFTRYHQLKTAFKPGQKPWNTGIKGLHFAGSEKGQFKKGHLPHNANRDGDGAISIRKDKAGKFHEFVRVSLGKWIHRKIIVWEQHHGKIPNGMCVRVKDGDTMNSSIENLELISRKENMQLNSSVTNLPDSYILHLLAGRKRKHLKEEFLKISGLIDLKRNIIKLKKQCKITESQQQ